MSHPDFPSGYIDVAGEISYEEGNRLFGASKSPPKRLSPENAVEADPLNPVAWKVFYDSCQSKLGHEDAWIGKLTAISKRICSDPQAGPKFKKLTPYLFMLSHQSGMLNKASIKSKQEFSKWIEPFGGSIIQEEKLPRNVFLQLLVIHNFRVLDQRRFLEQYHRKFNQEYFVEYWHANSFRFGEGTKGGEADIERFRSLSRQLASQFPTRPTPHFTIAMTAKDTVEGRKEAQTYLRLETRSFKKGWIDIVRAKYP